MSPEEKGPLQTSPGTILLDGGGQYPPKQCWAEKFALSQLQEQQQTHLIYWPDAVGKARSHLEVTHAGCCRVQDTMLGFTARVKTRWRQETTTNARRQRICCQHTSKPLFSSHPLTPTTLNHREAGKNTWTQNSPSYYPKAGAPTLSEGVEERQVSRAGALAPV